MRLRAGAVLWAATVGPAIFVTAWLVVALPLLLANAYRVLPTVLLAAALTVALCLVALRSAPPDVDWRVVAALLAIAIGFGVLAALTSGEALFARRDPGTYTVTALAYAQHGHLTVATHAAVFGHDPALIYNTPGFYPGTGGDQIVPQFLAGLPLLLSFGAWAAGSAGIALTNVALAAAAVLSVGTFATRVVGGRWAVVAAFGYAALQPVLVAARTPHSEPAVALLLFAGLTLLWDNELRRARGVFAVTGLVIGIGSVVRIDVFPIGGLLAGYGIVLFLRSRRREAIELVSGLAAGCVLGILDAQFVAANYSHDVAHKMTTAAIAIACAGVVVLAGALLVLRSGRLRELRRLLPVGGAVAVVLAALVAWTRPWWEVVRASNQPKLAQHFLAAIQSQQHVRVDPTRTYAEYSLHWIGWYVGLPALVIAVIGCALLLRQCLGGWIPRAAPFLLVFLGLTAFWVWRPSIGPDHPWADRRFVSLVFPGLVLCAIWLVRSAVARLRSIAPRRALALAGTAVVTVPALVLTARIALHAPNGGEPQAVQAACRSLPRQAAVLVVGDTASATLPPAIRQECGVPVAVLADPADVSAIPRLVRETAQHGYSLVLLGMNARDLSVPGGAAPARVAEISGHLDQRALMHPERRLSPYKIEIWVARSTVA